MALSELLRGGGHVRDLRSANGGKGIANCRQPAARYSLVS